MYKIFSSALLSLFIVSAIPAISLGETTPVQGQEEAAQVADVPANDTAPEAAAPEAAPTEASPEAKPAAAAEAAPAQVQKPKKSFLEKLAPIFILLVVVAIVLGRLPAVEGVNHSAAYRKRRVFNWLPLGMTYAFLYMGRYNIKVSQHAFGDKNL